MANGKGDSVHEANQSSNNHGNPLETPIKTPVNSLNTANVPIITISTPVKNPVTGETIPAKRATALKAWALRKGFMMGMTDTNELGNINDYVFAGILTFADTNQMQNLLQER